VQTMPSPSQPAPSRSRQPRILLAEDDRDLRELLASVLREDGYDVFTVCSGSELLEYIETSLLHSRLRPRPHLLITDVRMPGLSGLDVVSILAQSECLPRTIVITAFASEETRLTALKSGAAAVFDKPFDIDELRREVARQVQAA
jgi:DNA-binding response OmpR family regulator